MRFRTGFTAKKSLEIKWRRVFGKLRAILSIVRSLRIKHNGNFKINDCNSRLLICFDPWIIFISQELVVLIYLPELDHLYRHF